MKLNPPNAHRSQIKICEKRQTRNVHFRFMQNAFRILKPIQKSSKCVWVFRNTCANAVAKNQTRFIWPMKINVICTVQCTKRAKLKQSTESEHELKQSTGAPPIPTSHIWTPNVTNKIVPFWTFTHMSVSPIPCSTLPKPSDLQFALSW